MSFLHSLLVEFSLYYILFFSLDRVLANPATRQVFCQVWECSEQKGPAPAPAPASRAHTC